MVGLSGRLERPLRTGGVAAMIRCEFCQDGEAEICMSCFEAGRSQAPDANYSRLVLVAQSLLLKADSLSDDDSFANVGPEVRALRAVMRNIF